MARTAIEVAPTWDADENVVLTLEGVQWYEDSGPSPSSRGVGTLHVTSERVVWLRDGASEGGFELRYPAIAMHGVCRDAESFPLPCLYCQLDVPGDDGDGAGEGAGDAAVTEVRLVPRVDASDTAAAERAEGTEGAEEGAATGGKGDDLDALFAAMSDCSALHPDEDADGEEEAGAGGGLLGGMITAATAGGFLMSAEEVEAAVAADGDAAAQLQRLEGLVIDPPADGGGAGGGDGPDPADDPDL